MIYYERLEKICVDKREMETGSSYSTVAVSKTVRSGGSFKWLLKSHDEEEQSLFKLRTSTLDFWFPLCLAKYWTLFLEPVSS